MDILRLDNDMVVLLLIIGGFPIIEVQVGTTTNSAWTKFDGDGEESKKNKCF